MAYRVNAFTPEGLRQMVQTRQTQNTRMSENAIRKSVTASVKRSIFLSHSHSDIELASADLRSIVRRVIGDLGIDVYIDAFDPDMPRATSGITAEILKERIKQCDLLVLAATDNAVSSRWVPWEVGYADGQKGADKVAVLPISRKSGEWEGSEYLQIYQHILPAQNGGAGVFFPGQTSGFKYEHWVETA